MFWELPVIVSQPIDNYLNPIKPNIVSQPIDNYLNPIKPKFILNLGTPFKSRDKLLKDLFCTTSKVGINC